jgi:glutamate decarboxylase
MENTLSNARLLSRALEHTGWYRCVSDIHRKKGDLKYEKGKEQFVDGKTSADYNAGLPVVAFCLTNEWYPSPIPSLLRCIANNPAVSG